MELENWEKIGNKKWRNVDTDFLVTIKNISNEDNRNRYNSVFINSEGVKRIISRDVPYHRAKKEAIKWMKENPFPEPYPKIQT